MGGSATGKSTTGGSGTHPADVSIDIVDGQTSLVPNGNGSIVRGSVAHLSIAGSVKGSQGGVVPNGGDHVSINMSTGGKNGHMQQTPAVIVQQPGKTQPNSTQPVQPTPMPLMRPPKQATALNQAAKKQVGASY